MTTRYSWLGPADSQVSSGLAARRRMVFTRSGSLCGRPPCCRQGGIAVSAATSTVSPPVGSGGPGGPAAVQLAQAAGGPGPGEPLLHVAAGVAGHGHRSLRRADHLAQQVGELAD